MTQELERVYEGEVVEDKPDWESLISEWAEGARFAFAGQLRQARAIASVSRYYGRTSIEKFAAEVGCSKSWAYDLCRVWQTYSHRFEDGEISTRLESPLGISHYVKASYARDPQAAIEKAEDERQTTRQIEASNQEEKEQEHAGDERAEVVKTMPCPQCGGEGRVPVE